MNNVIEISRKLEIRWKLGTNNFAKVNNKVISEAPYPRKFGTAINAIKAMTVRAQEMRVLMPAVLGLDPTGSSDVNWEKAVNNYWNSLSVDIPAGGYPLEVGFRFDFLDRTKVSAIAQLRSQLEQKVDLSSNEAFAQYVMSEVSEYEKYLYGTPLNVANYLLWRYSENYRDVANKPTDTKGSRIRFYIYDPLEVEKQSAALHLIRKEALRKYVLLLEDKQGKRDLLWAMGENLTNLDELAIDKLLDKKVTVSPETFLTFANDKNLALKARIERYIFAGILRRVVNTSMIVDNANPAVVVGNTMDDAIAYFNAETQANQQSIAEFAVRYKALRSNTNK